MIVLTLFIENITYCYIQIKFQTKMPNKLIDIVKVTSRLIGTQNKVS